MNVLFKALKGAADGAFAVDEKLRINFWNTAAEKILGFNEGEVVGRPCYLILQGHDEGMKLICKACCQVAHTALKSKPVSNYDISVCTDQKERRWLNMSVITSNMEENGTEKMIVHLFRDISQKKDDQLFFHQILEAARRYHNLPSEFENRRETHQYIEKLTRREREVLTLLARGLNTDEIAGTLSISRNTVRNHTQHILQKLQVHSRLEAVTYALKNNLLDSN